MKRWPIILTGVVDELAKLNGENQASADEDKARLAEGKQLIQDISGLIYELRHDRVLSPIQGQSRRYLVTVSLHPVNTESSRETVG